MRKTLEYAGTGLWHGSLCQNPVLTRCVIKMETVLTLDRTMGGTLAVEKQDKENGVLIIRNSFPQLVDEITCRRYILGTLTSGLNVRDKSFFGDIEKSSHN